MSACEVNANDNATRVSESKLKSATQDNKWRRYRLRKIRREYEKSGEALLHTECLFCSSPIKPSYRRGFCPGGVCHERYLKAKPVLRVVQITRVDRAVSTRIATQYFSPDAVASS